MSQPTRKLTKVSTNNEEPDTSSELQIALVSVLFLVVTTVGIALAYARMGDLESKLASLERESDRRLSEVNDALNRIAEANSEANQDRREQFRLIQELLNELEATKRYVDEESASEDQDTDPQ